jgi:hypothetical protein
LLLADFELVKPAMQSTMVEYHRKIEGFYSDMFIWIENFNEKHSTTSEDANLYGEWLKS